MNRWRIAVAGVLLQMALGAVYAWSGFRIPPVRQFHWTISQVTLTFTIAIMVVGFASFIGGLWSKRVGPRVVALTGGVLYGGGLFLASFSNTGLCGSTQLWRDRWNGAWLRLHCAHLRVGEMVPDRRGLMTSFAVEVLGFGALITAPVATRLIPSVGVLHTFACLGITFLIISVVTGFFMQNR